METLARRAIEQTEGVLDSKLRIINHEDSVHVEVDITIGIETHVPVVTAMLQRNIKGIVEEFSGIAVREVVVLVTEIRNNASAALPAPKDEQMQQVVIVPEQVEHTVEPAVAEDTPAEEPAAEEPAEGELAAEEAAEPAEEAEAPAAEPAEEPAEEPAAEPAQEFVWVEMVEDAEEPAAETEEKTSGEAGAEQTAAQE